MRALTAILTKAKGSCYLEGFKRPRAGKKTRNTLVGLNSLSLTIAGTTHTGKLEEPSLLSHTKALQDFASSGFQFRGLFLVLLLTWGALAGTQHGTRASCQSGEVCCPHLHFVDQLSVSQHS